METGLGVGGGGGAREERTLAGEGAATAAAELSGAEPTRCDCDGMMAEPEK
jgi:hypothetical protein